MTAEASVVGLLGDVDVVEETLGSADDGATVVLISYDRGRSQVYQYRRAGVVVAEAPTLRILAELVAAHG